MKIKLVGFYDGLYSIGLRRLSSYTKQFYEDTELYLYNVHGFTNFLKAYFFPIKEENYINPDLLSQMADADVVGVSSMSNYAPLVTKFIEEVRKINPSCYIVWGGSHPIMDPETCVSVADAICVGEGEEAFIELLDHLGKKETKEIEELPGFWFRKGKEIIKNPYRELISGEVLSQMPFQDFSEDIFYVDQRTLCRLNNDNYLSKQGTNYMSLWSLGCPFRCSYCGNEKFLENDKKYARLRYPTPEFFVAELKYVLNKYDFIGLIEILDDNFFLIKDEDLSRFAELYKKEIGLPFYVPGIFPGTIRNESILDQLIDAGLSRVRMGIQSGSKKTLEFFVRPTSKKKIVDTANILISRVPKIAPPEFDLIMDIPFEKDEDKQETMSMLDSFKGPFIPLIYSLRTTPGTGMRRYAEEHPELGLLKMEEGYRLTFDKKYALQLYQYGIGKPSTFEKWLVKAVEKHPRILSATLNITILLWLARRLYHDLRGGNWATIGGVVPGLPLLLYKLKVLQLVIPKRKSLETLDLLNPQNRTLVTTSVDKIDHENSQLDFKKRQQREKIPVSIN